MKIALTEAQRHALKCLVNGNGEAALDRNGVAVGAGQRLPIDASTWVRLFTFGCIQPAGPLRFAITDVGRRAAETGLRP